MTVTSRGWRQPNATGTRAVALTGAAGVCLTLACDPAPSQPPAINTTPIKTADASAPMDDAPTTGDTSAAPADPDGAAGASANADAATEDDAPTKEDPGSASEDGEASATTVAANEDPASEDAAKKSSGQRTKKKAGLPGPVHRSVDDSCGKGPALGTKVKPFKLETPGGKAISPGMFRGRVVLLNFWGTWCKPCLEELPEFDRLYRRYRKHGLSLVAVATDEDAEAVQDYLDKRKIAAKVAIGGEKTAAAYGAGQFPFTFVVDADGVIRGSYSGYKEKCMGKLEQDIREELEKIAGH